MWQVVKFQPTALFTLRPANATTSGGKTLVTPTPYALKMALLDATIRVHGRAEGEKLFPVIRDLKVAVRLPDHLVVINTFVKILRPHKSGLQDLTGNGLEGRMGNTIAYRELVHYSGALWIAMEEGGQCERQPQLSSLFSQIHYLGKRGGFMQFTEIQDAEDLPPDFTFLNPNSSETFSIGGLLQLVDDCGPEMTFETADIYSGKSVSVGKPNGRVLFPVTLPYQLNRSGRSFSSYERITV